MSQIPDHVSVRFQRSCASRIELRQVRPRTDPVPAPHATLARPSTSPTGSVSGCASKCTSVSTAWLRDIWPSSADLSPNIDGHRHLRSAGRGQLDVPRVRLSTYGGRGRAFCYVGPSTWNALPDFLNKKAQLSLTNPRDACEKFARFT